MSGLHRVAEKVRSVLRSRHDVGATAAEYAILAGFIAVVIVGAVTAVGTSLIPIFAAMAAAL